MDKLHNKGAIVLLAAGQSSRLGQAKQLIKYNGETLLNRSIRVCSNITRNELFVVLGHQAEAIRETIDTPGNIIYNPEYKKGMGNSMSFAVRNLIQKNFDYIIFTLCDQIFLSENILKDLIKKFQDSNCGIILSQYDKRSGPPALFDKVYFEELIQLEGDLGAKAIAMKYKKDLCFISFPKGDVDIDEPSDLFKLP